VFRAVPVRHELNREVVVKALALAIATIDALEETIGGPMDWGKEDRDEMKRMVEILVRDDTDLERIANPPAGALATWSASESGPSGRAAASTKKSARSRPLSRPCSSR
jgi:hypothetical protein